MKVSIKQDLCNNCGVCGHICPRHIPETIKKNNTKTTRISHERINLCMECGHCVAVCPVDAIQVESLNQEDFAPVQQNDVDASQFLSFLKQRRSVRRYKDQSVPRENINQIVNAIHSAPTGTGKRTTGVIIIDSQKTLNTISGLTYKMYEELEKSLKNPIARFVIKKKKGERTLHTLQDFVMPGMRWYIRWFREGRSNEIIRNCPALMLFHSPIYEPVGQENCTIAAYHATLMAQIVGIGTCFNDLIPPACNRISEIRHLLGLPEDREVYACITMGYPKYKFRKTVPRKLNEVRFLD